MRKGILSVLMIPLLLLGGCGEREARMEKGFETFRSSLMTAGRLETHVSLTADYGGTTAEYELAVSYDGRETVTEILTPELLAGVKARSRWGEALVEFDGVLLGAGALDSEGLTPVSAVPAILAAMAGGYRELLWGEEGLIAARLYVGEESRCTVWLDDETLIPAAAEIDAGGRRVITCLFTDWTLENGPAEE